MRYLAVLMLLLLLGLTVSSAFAQGGGNNAPAQTTYVVQLGDTLFRIAQRFGVSVQALAQANGIINPNLIFAGQTLIIPSSNVPTAANVGQGGTTTTVGNKEDNACYPGGVMAGKCDTDWEWGCGYYLARWITAGGWSNRQNSIVDWCISLLPPKPEPQPIDAPHVTLCATSVGATVCLSSDQTGTFDAGSDGTIDFLELFTNGAIPGSCPATFGGKTLVGSAPTTAFTGFGFNTTDLFTTLGLATNFCEYG